MRNYGSLLTGRVGVVVFALTIGAPGLVEQSFAGEVADPVAPNAPDVSVWDGPGGTSVSIDGSTATITVRIDFCCRASDIIPNLGGETAADSREGYILDMVKAAQTMWNDALTKYPAKDCLKIKAIFDAKFVQDQQHWDPGYHRILTHDTATSSGSKDPNSTTRWDDTATVYGQSVGGEFFFGSSGQIVENAPDVSAMTVTSLAHEIGHLMGLGDDYYAPYGRSAIAVVAGHSWPITRAGPLISSSLTAWPILSARRPSSAVGRERYAHL